MVSANKKTNKTEDSEKEAIEKSFNLAAAKHNEGDLEQAEYIYRNILSVDAKHIQSNFPASLRRTPRLLKAIAKSGFISIARL